MTTTLPALLDVVHDGRWCSVVRVTRPAGRKTDIFQVVAKESCMVLAEIRWYGPWRKYALMPRADTVWEETCLMDLSRFMADETRQHRRHACRS
jgi:hypothetical protein